MKFNCKNQSEIVAISYSKQQTMGVKPNVLYGKGLTKFS